MIQDLATLAVVLSAAGYLLWKFGWKSRARRGPDVPLARLRRTKRSL